jgi:hypothetical protein
VSKPERAPRLAQPPAAGLDAGAESCIWLVLLVFAVAVPVVCDGLALVDVEVLGEADVLVLALGLDEVLRA